MNRKMPVAELIQTGKHFCIYPWVHLHINGNGDLLPCCVSTAEAFGNVKAESLASLWQGERMRNFRLKMLGDEQEATCCACYENDKVDSFSLRRSRNAQFQNYLHWVTDTDAQGYVFKAKPIHWDIRFSNICNLKCRTCGTVNSSSWCNDEYLVKTGGFFWGQEQRQFPTALSYSEKVLAELEAYLPEVVEIYCAGGEPLLMQENLHLLERLKQLGKNDLILTYNTNLTQVRKRREFIRYWKDYPTVKFLISLDGSQQRGEYLRKGIVWDELLGDLLFLKQECPQGEFKVNYTVSVFNILHLPDFHKEMITQHYFQADQLLLNLLHFPERYSVKILPAGLKRQATVKLLEHIEWLLQQPPCKANPEAQPQVLPFIQQWYACIAYLNSEDWTHLLPEFAMITNYLDLIRDESFQETFPELEALEV